MDCPDYLGEPIGKFSLMRPAALLTGLTGVVAVMVLVYVGLTAMNLEPHITFGDPNRLVAGADTSEAAKPAVALPPASAASPVVVTPTPPVVASAPASPPVEKPAPVPQQQAPAPAVETPSSALPNKVADAPAAATPVVPSTPVASVPAAPPAAPEPPPVPAANPASEAANALAAALSSTAPTPPAAVKPPVQETAKTPAVADATLSTAPVSPPDTVISASAPTDSPPAEPSAALPAPTEEARPPATPPTPMARPVEEAAKTDVPSHDLPSVASPSLPAIPTPLARPEPPPVEEAKASPAPEQKPTAPTPAAKAPEPVEEASLPPGEATAPKQPDAPVDTQTAALAPNAGLKPVDLSRPLAERAGVLTIGNKVVQLAGILPTDPARSCTGPNGKEWPCGTLARTALRAFLLGRTITCDVPDPQWKGPVTAECRFARVSLSDWLARNGWAEPAADSPLMAAADEARKSGLGIYGNDPRKKHISTLAPTPPPEDPLNPI